MFYATGDQEAILGRLLMDIVHGEITDETICLVDQLDPDDLALPMIHLVGYVQGLNRSRDMRAYINRSLLDELKIITIEQSEDLNPSQPEEEISTWQPDAPIPDRATPIIKDLLLEILQGKISFETLTAIDDLGDLEDVPEPYHDLLAYAQHCREDGKEIADILLYNLSMMIEQIRKLRS
jgi:hypothetical protein